MIESRLMEHAVALADQGSFALAAQALGLSQPALSRSIQSLETQLDVQLFERGHRRIEPTDAGQIFLEHAREILARNAALISEMGVAQQQRASFTLAVGPYVADTIAAPLLARLSKSHPKVQFRLVVTSWVEAVKRVRSREADLCIADMSQLEDDPDLRCEPLPPMQGYITVRAGHSLLKKASARKQGLSGAEIFSYPLVITSRLPPRILVPLQQERSPALNGHATAFPAMICEQISVIKGVVSQSDALGVFVLPLIENELRSGDFVPLQYHPPWLHTQFGIMHHSRRGLGELGAEVISSVRTIAAELQQNEQKLAMEFVRPKQPKAKRSG